MKEIKLNTAEMENAGVNIGHKVAKLHPKMKQYIAGVKNGAHAFDIQKTAQKFSESLAFLSKLSAENKSILFVGTKIQFRNMIRDAAEECGLPYVTERWLGGTFTNFPTVKKRVEYYKDLEKKKESGAFAKYTKKERLDFDKEIASLKTKFEGIKNMPKLPEAIVIFGLDQDDTCAREAKKKGVKIVAITDTNVNPDIADYPIPANDDAISSVKYLLEKIKDAIISSRPLK